MLGGRVTTVHSDLNSLLCYLFTSQQAGSIDAYLSERGIKIETGDPPEALAGLGFPLIEGGKFREPVERVAAL